MNKGRLSEGFRGRTKAFASKTIRLYVALPKGREEVHVMGRQLLRSGTSVAAHVREASRARSDAEYCSKIEGGIQEADESRLWIELLREDCGIHLDLLDDLYRESDELISICTTMVKKTKNREAK